MRAASPSRLFASWLYPAQVTIEYLRDGGHLEPLRVHTLLISTQHTPDISLQEVQDLLMQHVVTPVIPPRLLSADTQYFLNPSKRRVKCAVNPVLSC